MSLAPPEFLFVCVGPTCGERGGNAIFDRWRRTLVERGTWQKVRVAPVRCFGECATGPNGACPARGMFLRGMSAANCDSLLADVLREIGIDAPEPSKR